MQQFCLIVLRSDCIYIKKELKIENFFNLLMVISIGDTIVIIVARYGVKWRYGTKTCANNDDRIDSVRM